MPVPHILQSWEWGAFKERHGWRADHYLWKGNGEVQAAALVLNRSLRPFPGRIFYVPKGPVMDYDDRSLLRQVLSDLEGIARQGRGLFVKIDPDVPAEEPPGERVVEMLRSWGWRSSPEQIQFRNTLLLDLTPELDEIMADMKSKWRYNIRLAGRRGVTVRRGKPEDLPLLYHLYQETSQRNRFVIRPESYYLDVWGSLMKAGMAQPLIAEVEGETVAMVVLFRFAERAWYMYGASRTVHRDKMPNHLLQWESIRWAKEQGCTVYDLWGAPDVLDESDPMWGVYRFKKGFGAKLARHIGAYDCPLARLPYWLYVTAMPRLLALMRWRHWRREGDVDL